MPGRLVSSPDTAGHQMMFEQDRPVPATRKYLRAASEVQNGRCLSGRPTERRDGSMAAREMNGHFASGADMTSSRRLEDRPNYPLPAPPTSYQIPGQQLKPAATHRPQSAMAFSSSTSSYNHSQAMHPARPPSSLGVSWGPSTQISGISGNMKSHIYGEGVTLGEGPSGIPRPSGRFEDVYASVARRQDRVHPVETALGYDRYSHRAENYISDRQPGPSEAARGDGNSGRFHGLDNPAFVSDVHSGTLEEIAVRPPPTSLDMRSAWQRLYGNNLDPGVSSQRPPLDDAVSPGRSPAFEDAANTYSARQQDNYRPFPHLPQAPLHHPQIASQTQLQYAHIAISNPHEPAHNTPSTSTQNGRFTPHLVSPDLPPGNSSQNGRFTHHNSTIPHLQNGNSSQNGRFTPHLTAPDLQHNSTSQNGRFTPHLNSSDLPAGRLTPDHRRTTVRESPTGQSSSNPDPTSGSNNSSHLSADSSSTKTFGTFKPQNSNGSSDPTIGPSSKYPDVPMGLRVSTQAPHQVANHNRNRTLSGDKRADTRQSLSSPHFTSKTTSPKRQNSSTSETVGASDKEEVVRSISRFSPAFLDSDGSLEDEYSLQPHDSIFNYHEGGSEDGTVTPQATPSFHAPRRISRRSEDSTPVAANPGSTHSAVLAVTSPDFVRKTPDLLRKSPEDRTRLQTSGRSRTAQAESKPRAQLGTALSRSTHGQHSQARSKSLDDVRESENDSLLSFDVENTILTVEPSDQSDRGTVRSHKGSNSVRAQLHRLEGMYSHVMKTLEETSHGPRTRRRWSIGSSDTSSMRHHSHHSLHSRAASGHRLGTRDVKAIGKRFQRLESHVITLARSVAHLSSEMRVQNSLSREMENVKREIQELKSQRSASPALPGNLVRPNRLMSDFERYQGWVPSLTNPRRVNKLTKFFGQEPPLLEIFLKQLGYEKYLQNFEKEHIGMIELPYMTEDKLQTLGIPMGPRLRILQEAQLYLTQANLDLYFV